ncbi:hypothetical protein OG241_31675 [Streptomyces sp. NBC_01390]|uniref:hypothetical protein n=1 Tax=Streptomyces sp. NBC_01390 TaxID=2903850 RepID=UPI003248EA4E
MSDLIGRLITQMSLLLTRRYRHRRTCPTALPLPMAAPPTRPTLPTHRSPYGLDAGARIEGTATRSVRPYLVAHEQRLRRRELAMATPGLDMPGPYWIHGMEVA